METKVIVAKSNMPRIFLHISNFLSISGWCMVIRNTVLSAQGQTSKAQVAGPPTTPNQPLFFCINKYFVINYLINHFINKILVCFICVLTMSFTPIFW